MTICRTELESLFCYRLYTFKFRLQEFKCNWCIHVPRQLQISFVVKAPCRPWNKIWLFPTEWMILTLIDTIELRLALQFIRYSTKMKYSAFACNSDSLQLSCVEMRRRLANLLKEIWLTWGNYNIWHDVLALCRNWTYCYVTYVSAGNWYEHPH